MTTARKDTTQPQNLIPRGLQRQAAAFYVGVSVSKFDEWVSDGRGPQPRLLDGCLLWDIRDLDRCFEALPTREAKDTAGAPGNDNYNFRA